MSSGVLPLFLLVVVGFVGGFFGSAVGSAGLVSLPALLFLGLSPHEAIATTRPAAAVLEAMSALRYRRDRALTDAMLRRGLALGCCGAVGATIGATFIPYIGDQTLRLLLASIIVLMFVVSFARKNWGLVERPERQRRIAPLAVATVLTGLYAGLFGFTFGTVITIVLAIFGYTLLQSAAMGRVIGAITSGAAAAVFATQGSIHYPEMLALSAGFAAGGWVGAGVGAKLGSRYVKTLLTVVVCVSVGKLLFDYVSAL